MPFLAKSLEIDIPAKSYILAVLVAYGALSVLGTCALAHGALAHCAVTHCAVAQVFLTFD